MVAHHAIEVSQSIAVYSADTWGLWPVHCKAEFWWVSRFWNSPQPASDCITHLMVNLATDLAAIASLFSGDCINNLGKLQDNTRATNGQSSQKTELQWLPNKQDNDWLPYNWSGTRQRKGVKFPLDVIDYCVQRKKPDKTQLIPFHLLL